jgi:hypothetical protein
MQWIIERLAEKSTWAGIGGFVLALAQFVPGLKDVLTPDTWNTITQAGLAIVAVVAVFVRAKPAGTT